MAEGNQLIRGLEGVVAAETELCDLDGARGRLAYRGYDIEDLARKATFEEVAYLLANQVQRQMRRFFETRHFVFSLSL